MRPKISIIIPVYNGMTYIRKCIESAMAQTLKDIEILVINDGSTDGTEEIILDCMKTNPKIRYIKQENRGLYQTRSRGIREAKGEYLGWIDADDFVAPDMYEKLYCLAEKNNSDIAYCDYAFYPQKIGTKEKWFRKYKGSADTSFVERNSQWWNKIVRRDVLIENEIDRLVVTCFDECYIKLLISCNKISFLEDELYYYRMGEETMSSSYKNVEHYISFIDASVELQKELYGISEYWDAYFEYRVIYYMLMTLIVSANKGDRCSYISIKRRLRNYNKRFWKNMHFSKIVNENFGRLKAICIGRVIPISYGLSRLICKLAFR